MRSHEAGDQDHQVIAYRLGSPHSPRAVAKLHLRAISLKLPFAAVPGNHDAREMMRAAFPDRPYAFSSGPLNQKIELAELDLLLLDSSVPGQPHGELDEATLQWLDVALGQSTSRPGLLFLHHPPFMTGVWHMDRQPAFHLHTWFPGEGFGSVVTHQVPVGEFDGPHPFFGPDGKLL